MLIIIIIALAAIPSAFIAVYSLKETPADFILNPSSTGGSVSQGGSTTVIISVENIGAYNQTVSLTASGQPAEVIVSFEPTSDVPSFTSTMRVEVGGSAAGEYDMTIIGRGADGKEHNTTYVLTVEPNYPPVANFTYLPSSPVTSDTIQFTDWSMGLNGRIVSWSWTFGDGTTSTAQNPTHQYTSAGAYTVTLTATDDNGLTDDFSRDIEVSTNLPPTADFTFSPDPSIIGGTVRFTDQSTDPDGRIVSWSWTFGDGMTSTLRNTTYQYGSAGSYTVTLTVTDDRGNIDEILKTVEILPPSRVKIESYQLFVNGSPFTIKGVCYSPTPVGLNVDWGYNWWSDPNTYRTDFSLIKEMGANTIRTYDARNAKHEAMNAAYNEGIFIIMSYWVNWSADLSDAGVRQGIVDEFKAMVRTWKNHPAVLIWAFGNEVNQHISNKSDWYILLQEAAQSAHEEEGENYHPVIAVEAEVGTIGDSYYRSDDGSLPALDAWGINVYRGSSFGGLFSVYQSKSSKPLILTEWGCDALDIRTMAEDQGAQANYLESLWGEIENQLGVVGGRCLGGTVFEWSDEWWKGGDPSAHDKTGQWSNSTYYDYTPGQNNMNEEWWGIVTVSPGMYTKTPRQSYHKLKSLWT